MATNNSSFYDFISEFSTKYSEAKKGNFIKNPFGSYVRKTGPSIIRKMDFIDNKKYKIAGSVGQYNTWADVPWVAVFIRRITTSARSGVYIVYLRATNGDIYLTLNQGCEQNEDEEIVKDKNYLSEYALKIRERIKSDEFSTSKIDLKAPNNVRAKNYELATIYSKKYSFESIPDENTLRNDLIKMIEIYDEYIEKFVDKTDEKPSSRFTIPETMKNDPYFVRFTRSLLAKPFVILTGNSGTGKTRIAIDFAKSMEVRFKDEKNYELVPVGADWTDNTPILGYYNPLGNGGKGEYVRTKILDLILRAIDNPEYPFFLILDEMNLSHVERYFSDFLSLMESPKTEFEIKGYSEKKYTYPDNLFIVGTVNIDETTYMFSPKVLDRANVIEFKPKKEAVMALFKEQTFTKDPIRFDDSQIMGFMSAARKINESSYKMDLSTASKVFEDIYEVLSHYDIEFSYRTIKEICRYFYAANELDGSDAIPEEIIDQQIVQKILPKIHGNKRSIGNMLKDLADKIDEKFELSNEKISKMQTKLDNTQYVSFI